MFREFQQDTRQFGHFEIMCSPLVAAMYDARVAMNRESDVTINVFQILKATEEDDFAHDVNRVTFPLSKCRHLYAHDGLLPRLARYGLSFLPKRDRHGT